MQENLETLVREQLRCESRRAFRSEACKRECTNLFETTVRRLREGKWVDPRVYFGTLTSLLTETATNALYKFDVPGEENDGSLQQALWAAQPKPVTAAPQARSPTKRKAPERHAKCEQLLMEIKTTLETVKKSSDYHRTQMEKLTSRVNVLEQQAEKKFRTNAQETQNSEQKPKGMMAFVSSKPQRPMRPVSDSEGESDSEYGNYTRVIVSKFNPPVYDLT